MRVSILVPLLAAACPGPMTLTGNLTDVTGAPAQAERVVGAVSADRVIRHVHDLAGFGTRHTFSRTDLDTAGIGAARRYLLAQFESFGGRLESELADGMKFFKRGLDEKLIVVPGEFFDVNPGKRRPGRASRFREHARFSYGAPLEVLEEGLHRIARMVGAGG